MELISLPKTNEPKWGPTGKDVYERTYSRTKADGSKESWYETVTRVVDGNLSLVPSGRIEEGERSKLIDEIYNFRIIPAGRHLWMSGVEGRQFLFNCYVSGWGNSLSEHFAFTFNQLMEGGGVGSNYSTKYLDGYCIYNLTNVHIVCSPEHDDYEALKNAGLLSTKYSHDWPGAEEVEDSREGWVEALTNVIEDSTEFFGEGFTEPYTSIFDVSNIRASGKRIKTFGGTSAGPVPLARLLTGVSDALNDAWETGAFEPRHAMRIDHIIANCVVSGNVRRSARMSIMHWDDPSIDWFLQCKKNGGDFWSTNISVEIDDEFIDLIAEKNEGTSKHGYNAWDTQVRRRKANAVYRAILEGMLTNGEPGIWNSSLANLDEPNPIIATNPCGEICLEAWENCNLGHVNLDAFVFNGIVDWDGLLEAHRLMTRFLMRATYGDITYDKTRKIVDRNRRIGVGHFGFAGFLAKRQIKFSDSWQPKQGINMELQMMKTTVDDEAYNYAHELRIPVPVKKTTVAPTGTIAKLAGRSEGIHPVYARYFIRRIRYSMVDPDQNAKVQEFIRQGYTVVKDTDTEYTWIVEIPTKEALVQELEDLGIHPSYLESVDEIPLTDLVEVQKMYQTYYADNAVSFTMNVVPGKYDVEDLMTILTPRLSYLKGTTIMVDESRKLAPYERISAAQYLSMRVDDVVDDSYDENCASGACPVR